MYIYSVIYIYLSFSDSFIGYYKIVLYNRFLLVIYFIYSGVYRLVPNS